MQKLLSHPITLALCTTLAIIFYVSLDKSTQTVHTSATTLQSLEQQNKKLDTEVKILEEQVQSAQTELAKEKIIRNELLLQKPGEYVVQLPEDILQPHQKAEDEAPETPWEAWKRLLN